ncbi:MAG: DUF285 domain-containing protein, partial [archaeon]|nr:DUF285 domain-containing protein [archaeon]
IFINGKLMTDYFHIPHKENEIQQGYIFIRKRRTLKETKGFFRYWKFLYKVNLENSRICPDGDFSFFFCECKSLESVNFRNQKIKKAESLFSECTSLTSIDFEGSNTIGLINASKMFYRCSSLIKLDLSFMDDSDINNCSNMMNGCTGLKEINLDNLEFMNLKNASGMFDGCDKLKILDLSNWNTSNLENIDNMFGYICHFDLIDLSNWNTSNIKSIYSLGKIFSANDFKTYIFGWTQLNLNKANLEKNSLFEYCFFGECEKLPDNISNENN